MPIPTDTQKIATVADLIQSDRWEVAELRAASTVVGMIRYRTPVLSGKSVSGYTRVLKVVWPYAEEGSQGLPSAEQSLRMTVFEDRFVEAVEHDARAVLVAVLTFDGVRQWVFYTNDIADCGARLGAMPQEAEPYPLELTSDEDPAWQYLHDEILAQVPHTP